MDRRGAVAIQMGVVLTVLIGMAALGTEITFVLYKHRQMQAAADAAAFGGATALTRGYPTDPATEARAIAAAMGFTNGVGGVTVAVNRPPASGLNAGNSAAVEAIVSQTQTLPLVSWFTATAFNVSARAVALQGSSGGNFCVLTTDTSSTTSVAISNGATVTMNSCGLAVNANGSSALVVQGGSVLRAQSVSVSGQASVNNGGSIVSANGVSVNQPAVADPYANVPTPAQSGCAYTNRSLGWASSVQQLTPGAYCDGLTISNGAVVSMAPGIYYIKSGSFNLGGGSTVTGSGVTIVLTQNTSGYATATIGNGSSISLSAPTSGATAGIVFFADRNSPNTNTVSFTGGASETFTGALYLPSVTVSYSNGNTNSSSCTQLIAWRIQFSGGSQFSSNCGGTGTSSIGAGTASQLVE